MDLALSNLVLFSSIHHPATTAGVKNAVRLSIGVMDPLEERTQTVIEDYRRRFHVWLDVPVLDLDVEARSRFVAALEHALHRNMPLFDYELQPFQVSRWRRIRLRLKRGVVWVFLRR